jgi:hypothetical protein
MSGHFNDPALLRPRYWLAHPVEHLRPLEPPAFDKGRVRAWLRCSTSLVTA